MKGNEEEIGKLPRNILENQKKKMLIITRGARGVLVYFHNKKYEFIGKKIRSVNTIGAGDTFFANFIVTFLKTDGNIMESGNFAISKTEKFLLMKK
jgi:sugar/nucleoside kinase (ribokinase family)